MAVKSSSDTSPEAKPEGASATTSISLDDLSRLDRELERLGERMGELFDRRKRQGEFDVNAGDILTIAETQVVTMRLISLLAKAIVRL